MSTDADQSVDQGPSPIDLSTLSEEDVSKALTSPTSNVNLDQVRDILRTKSIPTKAAAPETPTAITPTEQPDQPTEVPGETEEEPQATTTEQAPVVEGETPEQAAPEGEGEAPAEGAGEPPDVDLGERKGKRARVTVGHLPPAQRKVIDLVSIKGIQIPDAQAIVVREMMEAGWAQGDAERAVFGQQPARQPGEKQTQAESEAPPERQLTKAEQAWQTAEKEINDANIELQSATESYDVTRIEAARTKLNDARWQKFYAEQSVQQERQYHAEQARNAFLTEVNQSSNRILGIYPEAGRKDSPLWDAVADRIVDIEQSDPHFFNRLTNWPEYIVAAEAARLGVAPLKQQKTATANGGLPPVNGQQKSVSSLPAPKRAAVKLTPAAGASSDGQPPETTLETEEDATRYVASLVDPDDKEKTLNNMKALLRSGGRVVAAAG